MDVTNRFKTNNLSILKTIGKGTYGDVYLCENITNNTLSIVKDIELNEKIHDHNQDITNEVKILSSMKHPNIVRFYDCHYSDNHVMITMEYATHGNLAEYMYQRYPKLIKQPEILFYFCQILIGVNYIHNLQIIHRDLKAENILLTGKNGILVKIGDFGISKMLQSFIYSSIKKNSTVCQLLTHPHCGLYTVSNHSVEQAGSSAKKTSTVIGTPYYLAPELCEGKPYDTKSDVWALGCLLYEMCTHKRAFHSESLVGLVKAITSGSVHPIDLTVYERGMQDLIDSMLSILPEKRPTVKELMGRMILLSTVYSVFLDAGNDEFLYLKAKNEFLNDKTSI